MLIRITTFLLLAALFGCGGPAEPEEQVRAVIEEAEQAAEARSIGRLAELVSDDYDDGRFQRDELLTWVRAWLIAHQSVRLVVRVDELELMGLELARVRATVGLLGREAGESFELAMDIREFDVTLALEGSQWRVIRADWERGDRLP
ncbi:MAG: hypothetical protein ACO37Y_08330 [Steroidobacteraceae bacterium]